MQYIIMLKLNKEIKKKAKTTYFLLTTVPHFISTLNFMTEIRIVVTFGGLYAGWGLEIVCWGAGNVDYMDMCRCVMYI